MMGWAVGDKAVFVGHGSQTTCKAERHLNPDGKPMFKGEKGDIFTVTRVRVPAGRCGCGLYFAEHFNTDNGWCPGRFRHVRHDDVSGEREDWDELCKQNTKKHEVIHEIVSRTN